MTDDSKLPRPPSLKSETRQTNWRLTNLPKYQAHLAVQRALISGVLEKQNCEVCGAVKVDAHHDRYDEPNSIAAYGDTETQTVSVLKQIETKLQDMGLSMGDVVKMQVYLVAPSEEAPMDFAGFMKGYTQFFGTDAQKNLPTRSVFQVAGLVNPGWLVEIEVEAVRP